MIKIDFEMIDSTGVNTYRDALHLADDHTFTEEEIQAMKQARFDNWLAIILNPEPAPIADITVDAPVEVSADVPVDAPADNAGI